jgi:hypothetical protein
VVHTTETNGHPSLEGRVLAVGWHPGDKSLDGTQSETLLVYLVLDRLAKKKTPFWVRSDFVESVTETA